MPRSVTRRWGLLSALATLWLGLPSAMAAPACALEESYDYIQRFIPYVRWPDEANVSQWRICVVSGAEHARRHFSEVLARGKPFEVLLIDTPAAVAGCHVLDLTPLELGAATPFVEAARAQPLLIFGQGRAMCSAGAQVCLDFDAAQPFEVNLNAITRVKLKVNARVLRLGHPRKSTGEPG